jgi:hypothetical protein
MTLLLVGCRIHENGLSEDGMMDAELYKRTRLAAEQELSMRIERVGVSAPQQTTASLNLPSRGAS